MKQGISLFSFSENTDVRWMFEHAKKAGYDGVEPVLSESGYLNPQTPEKDVLAMKRMADDMGLEIPSVGVWSLWQYNLVSDSEKTRQKAFGIVQKQIEAAYLLGAKTILVVPGYVGCNFVEHPEKIRYDIAYERAQDALSRLAPEAGIGAFVDLFAGDVDFPAVAKAIAGIGYDDYITLEMLPNYKQFPEVSLYADKYAMNKIIEMIHL